MVESGASERATPSVVSGLKWEKGRERSDENEDGPPRPICGVRALQVHISIVAVSYLHALLLEASDKLPPLLEQMKQSGETAVKL